MHTAERIKDKASYRNRGSLFDRIISAYKGRRYLTNYGSGLTIRSTAEFRLTEGAILEVGENVIINDFVLFQLTLPNPRIYIGDNVIIGRHNIITSKGLIRIGNNVLIGSYVQIIDHSHGIARDIPIREQRALIGEVSIGDDVWIGAGAKVLMNTHIGTGAVIGANAVVTCDIPDYAVAIGAPARVVKYRE